MRGWSVISWHAQAERLSRDLLRPSPSRCGGRGSGGMQFDMRPDRVGWTVFEVSTGRPVTWAEVSLIGVDLDTAHELLALLHRQHRLRAREACHPRITDERSDSVLVDAAGPRMRRSEPFRRA